MCLYEPDGFTGTGEKRAVDWAILQVSDLERAHSDLKLIEKQSNTVWQR
jgi:hypothetical protein